MKNIGRGGKN